MSLPEVVFVDPQAEPRTFTSTKHVVVNAEGIELVDSLKIRSYSRARSNHGFLRIEFGDVIGPDKHYKFIQKL
jgi:hypothetical protein